MQDIQKTGLYLRRNSILIYFIFLLLVIAGVVIRPLSYFAFTIAVAFVILQPDETVNLALLFFLMPIATVFKPSAGSTSFFTYIELVFVLKQLIKKHHLPSKFFFGWFLFSGYVIIGMGSAVTDAIKQIIIPIMIYIGMLPENREKIDNYIELYALGTFFSSVLGLVKGSIPNLSSYVSTKVNHLGSGIYIDRFAGLWGDPNYYSINLMLLFAALLYLYSKKKISLPRISVYYLLIVIFGAMTRSQSFIVVLAVTLVFMIVILFQTHHPFAGIISIAVIAVALFMIVSGRIELFDSVLLRMQTVAGRGDITTGRLDKWSQYFTEFANNPVKLIIGNGVGKGFSFVVPHNTYIDYLDIYGILGTTVYCGSLISINRAYERNNKFVNWLPMLILLAMYAMLSMIFYLDMVFQIMLAAMILYSSEAETDNYIKQNYDAEKVTG